jgi:DNA invertase Pin-like site-specific DNA recombinase
MPKPPALGYVRVSTTEQASDGHGLQAQEHAIREYTRERGLRLVAVYRDGGASGTLADRPALGEALAAVEGGNAETLIVARLDRLARDLVLQETVIGRLQAKGRQVVSVAEPDVGGDDPTRTLVRQVLGAIGQYERALIRARMMTGKAVKAANGGYVGGRPGYGQRAVDGELAENRDESER